MKRIIKKTFSAYEKNIFKKENTVEWNPSLHNKILTDLQSSDIEKGPITVSLNKIKYCIPVELTNLVLTHKIENYV